MGARYSKAWFRSLLHFYWTQIHKGENLFHRDGSSPGLDVTQTDCTCGEEGAGSFPRTAPRIACPKLCKPSPLRSPEGLKTLPAPRVASSQHTVLLFPHPMPSSHSTVSASTANNCWPRICPLSLPATSPMLAASLQPPSASVRATQDPRPHLVAVSPRFMSAERFRVPNLHARRGDSSAVRSKLNKAT